ncbi:hypothetical protein NDU88_003025 [Pleurodeles waltl]|uniref:Uncharacterized protein n=1 Tax=Pleurodeles waltl TaxID=8319 RepID=A0AAV7M5Q9_PLEWA|nr:hypothetical protein NDU88_003025 [Pleurodeles waltl]
MENHGAPVELDIEEIIRASTRSKDWILNQIRGLGAVEGQSQEEHDNDRPGNAAKDNNERPSEAKKRQRNTSRGTNNGEQISMIVQECLKSMASLLFASPGGVREPKGSGGADSNGDTASSNARGKRSLVNRAEVPRTRCPSTERGDEDAASTSATASPTQVWGTDADKNARRRHNPADGGLSPEAYKRGSLGRPYMVARAPGLASMIPLAVKERIWRREFIDVFTLLEIRVDLTTVDKKEEERRERNIVRKERNFDNWLDAFRIMVCIIVEKYPHCAKDLWLYESKIHAAQRQFTVCTWLDYDKGFRLKIQAHSDMEWDEEDVAGYMHKMMIAGEAKSWATKGEQPFRGGFQKGRHEKVKPFYKRQQYTQTERATNWVNNHSNVLQV